MILKWHVSRIQLVQAEWRDVLEVLVSYFRRSGESLATYMK